MSHCGGCNMTPVLFNDFKLTLLQQKPKPNLIHPFDKVSLTQNVLADKVSLTPITPINSQLTNNGKFLKFTRKT
jgi:hypothetical protein